MFKCAKISVTKKCHTVHVFSEFAQKTFDAASSRVTTHCLPFLQLDCVAMETFNPAAGSNHYLANM